MHTINKILVCLDPMREQQPALDKALYLAKAYDASIELFLVVYNRGLVGNSFFNPQELEAAKKGYVSSQKRWVESYLDCVTKAGIECSFDVVWHKPLYEAIIQKADSSNIDLVIKSTHKHPLINKVFFTPNDWQLLKSCRVPLILTKLESSNEYQSILAAIDPSHAHDKPDELDPQILKSSSELAAKLEGQLHITHCYEPIAYQLWSDIGLGMGAGVGPADFSMGEDNYDEYVSQLNESQQKSFDKTISDYPLDEKYTHLEEGYPETLLPELVNKYNIDLLVLGTSYHTGLIGSTAEKLLDQLECDILSVQIPQS